MEVAVIAGLVMAVVVGVVAGAELARRAVLGRRLEHALDGWRPALAAAPPVERRAAGDPRPGAFGVVAGTGPREPGRRPVAGEGPHHEVPRAS